MIILALILAILIIFVIIEYNSMVKLKKQMNNSYSVIDVYLQKRFDLIHIPNEGKRTRWEGQRVQRMGLRAGTPDYLISKDGKPLCWLEFKFGKNGLTDSQQEFRDYAKAGGFGFEVVRTFEEFKAVLIKWGVYTSPKDDIRTSFEQLFKKGE